jgi:cell division protein FtsI (penicillin-binding protein 3)
MSKPLDRFFNKPATSRRVRRRKLPVAPSVPRLRILLILVAVVFSLAAGRAVQVQAIDGSSVALKANEQSTYTEALPAIRGSITGRNGEVLAFTDDTYTVAVSPRMVATNGRMNADMTAKDKETAAGAPPRLAALLSQFLGDPPETYLAKLTEDPHSGYKMVKTGVAAATFRSLLQAVSDAGLVGVSGKSTPTRRYPNGKLAANVIGYVNASGVGSAGLEYVLNSSLAGTPGKEVYQRAANGERLPMGTYTLTPAINGVGYVLTIDPGLQWLAEQALANQLIRTGGKWGSVIITNPKTGEVLAMAVAPSFDPAAYGKADADALGNPAVTASYTPGSVQKVLTMAALLDQNLVDPDEVVTIPDKIKSGDNWVKDAWSHGTIKLRARGIVAKSSNIGTITLARRASKQSLHDYQVAFGLGAKTKIGLPGEATGSIPAADMPDWARDGQAFGGSAESVTMVQMAAAVGALANGGVYTPLQLVASKTDADGVSTKLTTGQAHRVVSEDTATKVLSMMEAMAQNNHQFDVPGYRVGAKTGTSKKFDTSCGCYRGLVASAISVAPIENPQVLVYAVVDNPSRGQFGSDVAGPVVQELMKLAMARYGVPQSGPAPSLPIKP